MEHFIADIFACMGLSFMFVEMCSPAEAAPFVANMVGCFNARIANRFARESRFITSKYDRSIKLLTYYILWNRCIKAHPHENVMIWEDSVIVNTLISSGAYLESLYEYCDNLPQFDMLLLGYFPQPFKTVYPDDGRSRMKCDIPVCGYAVISEHMLKLSYAMPSGATIYSPRGLAKLVDGIEAMMAEPLIYPFECFLAGMMGAMAVYAPCPALFGQIVPADSVIMRHKTYLPK